MIQSGARKDILKVLTDAAVPMYPAAIAKALTKNANTTRVHLMKMRNDGVLQTLRDGAQWFANRAVPGDYVSKPAFGSKSKPDSPQPDDIPILA